MATAVRSVHREPATPEPADSTGVELPLRIMLVEFLPSGGMFQFSFQFGEALAAAGHRVVLLTGPDPELTSQNPNFEVMSAFPTWHPNSDTETGPVRRKVRRIGRALLLAESWRRVLLQVRRESPGIVQFGELRYLLDTACLLVLARFGHAGGVVDVAHNPMPYDVNSQSHSVEKQGGLTRRLLGKAYAACDLVLLLGDGPRAELLASFPEVRRSAVCGHGNYSSVLDSRTIQSPSSAPANALFFGAWTKYKNIPLLLDAFALLRRELPQSRLTLAGPVMPDVDLDAITEQARRIGNVDLAPGYVAMSDLPRLFGAHRAVVFTYATVNISGSIHMAYTFGRPVVATDVGSMGDVVEHGVTGLLAAPEPVSVAHALRMVLDDPAAADRMGAEAARHAEHSAAWTGVAERAAVAYRSALSDSVKLPS